MWIVLYPFISTVWCLYKPLKADIQHWLIWWLSYEIITGTINNVLWWVPLLRYFESFILMSLYLPMSTSELRRYVLLKARRGANKKRIRYVVNYLLTTLKKSLSKTTTNLNNSSLRNLVYRVVKSSQKVLVSFI